ncbi:MAG TPA: hypothetical protein VF211_03760 [Burkholderiales bacterium]
MTDAARPLAAVPRWLRGLLVAALAAQLALHQAAPPAGASARDLPPAPQPALLRLASLGEPPALARLLMLYLQAFDLGGGNVLPYRRLDYRRLADWLRAILALDPKSQYPLFSAARVYAEVPDRQRMRQMLELIHDEYLADPNRRWPWLAHAAILAKHRLGDLPLALRYAAAIERHTTDPGAPLWAKHMQIFILEDMGELEAERIMIGSLIESGRIREPAELGLLKRRLEELERRR